MSFNYTQNAIRRNDLTLYEKMVLIVIADLAGEKGDAWPSYRLICERAMMCRAKAISCVNSLVEKGALIREARIREGGNSSNQYTIIKADLKAQQNEGDSKGKVKSTSKTGASIEQTQGSTATTQNKSVNKSVNKSLKHYVDSVESPRVVGGEENQKPALQKEDPKPKAEKKPNGKTLPEINREEVVSAWNYTAETHGLPKIMAVSLNIEKGLLRLWRSYVHMCRSLKREPRDATEFICGYLGGAYKPTAWACGDNPTGKKYGIDTALRQERIDQILQELFSEVAQ